MAALIKHRVEDGKLIIDMQCKDITCRKRPEWGFIIGPDPAKYCALNG